MELKADGRRNAVLFVTVSLAAGFGGNAMILTAGIWVMSLTGDARLAALATACVYVPSLAGPMIGALADRLPRQALLVRTAVIVAGGLLTLLAVRGPDRAGPIFAVMLGYGAALVLMDAAEAGLLPAALPGDALGAVNGLRMSAQEGVKLVAPLAGAALFTLSGAAPVILLCAALLGVSAALYGALRLPRPGAHSATLRTRLPRYGAFARGGGSAGAGRGEPGAGVAAVTRPTRFSRFRAFTRGGESAGAGPGETPSGATGPDAVGAGGGWTAWVVGVGHLRREAGLGAIVLVATAAMAAAALGSGVLYAMIDEGLGRDPAFAGVLSSVQGGGAILGGLLSARLLSGGRLSGRAAPAVETALVACGAVLVAVALVLRTVPWSPVVIAGSLILGLGLPWTVVAAVTAVQRGTPEARLGRVSATATSLIFATPAIATPAATVVLPIAGYRPVLLFAASLALGAGVLALIRGTPYRPNG
ncbi:MFS transporter [Catenuloplanes indicus]|uniref:Energy-converting hydrogenase Eha subunit A n=1 Tax=Catenuloplanes indicus TaxID=137267 RepID=A0AAE3W749_9ACTN|nr:MFS transporter [Catenuloplanes indicus]MDQ0370565.1 energy-converting hydrogenase Eha subunit A [Catenuloplanes indicus]